MCLPQIRSSKPGRLLSVAPCKSFGLRPQVEFRSGREAEWALEAIKTEARPVALFDHAGAIVAQSAAYPARVA